MDNDAATRRCPLCGSKRLKDAGAVVHQRPARVAGVIIDLDDINFRFAKCDDCRFIYKNPPLPSDRLLECYRQSAGDHWGVGSDAHERKYDRMGKLIREHVAAGRVLDIGCSNGDFLHSLGGDWRLFGVEPSEKAAEMARARGITILGPTIESLGLAEQFDAIAAIDVLEHIVDPIPFLQKVAALLKTGGVFLIVTGDSESRSWRWCKNTYWYCSLPEHTSFYCRPAIENICQRLGLECVTYHRESHALVGGRQKFVELTKNVGYRIGRAVRGLGLPRLRRLFVERGAPGWLSAKDHMFCLLRKK